MSINQKISEVIDSVLSDKSTHEQQDGRCPDQPVIAVSEQPRQSNQCTPPNSNTGAWKTTQQAINLSKQANLQQSGKRDKPEERSPDCIETKKSKENVSCSNKKTFDINLSEIELLRSDINSIFNNIQPLVIKEVQHAFDSVIARLDSIESRLKALDCHNENRPNEKADERISFLEEKVENLEQYSRRQQLLFEGIPESNDENTDICVIEECKKVNITLTLFDIQRSHRLGRRRDGRPRPIIVHLANYRQKRAIIQAAKRDLFDKISAARQQKKKGPIKLAIQVKECLTSKRAELLRLILQLKEKRIVKSVWTVDGVIVIRMPDSDRLVRISTERQFREFANKL